MFRVTPENGFLPAVAPLRELPPEFAPLEEVRRQPGNRGTRRTHHAPLRESRRDVRGP
jgi:hypothetical protein